MSVATRLGLVGLLAAAPLQAQQKPSVYTVDVVIEEALMRNPARADSLLNALRTYHTFNINTQYIINSVSTVAALPQNQDALSEKLDSILESRENKEIVLFKNEYLNISSPNNGSGGKVGRTRQRFGLLRTATDSSGQELSNVLVLSVPSQVPGEHLGDLENFVYSELSHENFHRTFRGHPIIGEGTTNTPLNFEESRQRRPYNPAVRYLETHPEQTRELKALNIDGDSLRVELRKKEPAALDALNLGNDAYASGEYEKAHDLYVKGIALAKNEHLRRELQYSAIQLALEGRVPLHLPTGQPR